LVLSDATRDTERLRESNYSKGDVNAGSPIFVITNVISLFDCQIPGYARSDYTFDEEFRNVITHVSALAFASYHLLTYKNDMELTDEESQKKTLSPTDKRLLLFSFTMLYANSILYHAFVPRIVKTIFRFIDHLSVVITMLGTTAPMISVLFGVIAVFVYFRLFCWVEFESWKARLSFPFTVVCSAQTIRRFNIMDARARFQSMKGLFINVCRISFFIRYDVRYAHPVFPIAIAAGSYSHYCASME
jgi:predicted membrane channel-forming protein YqfA (hemolysin III family)